MTPFSEDPDVFTREGRTFNGSDAAEVRAKEGESPRFPLTHFDDLKPGNDSLYLVKRMIPRVGLTLIWGKPKCGKSFFTFDLMMHVALGWDYRGHKVSPGPVVYCAFEGASGFNLRAEAFRQQHGIDAKSGAQLHLVSTALDLVQDHEALIASISAQSERPSAVVLDTLNRSLRGSESSDEDMAAYVRAADAIREAFNCAVIVVHHCGHDENRPRGHSSLLGAVDAQIAITRRSGASVIAIVERMKDGPEGATIGSQLEQVEVGIDEDGDPLTSCIVVEGEAAQASTKTPTLSKSATIGLHALQEAIIGAGEAAPTSNHIPTGARIVTVNLWRQYAYQRGISAADSGERAKQQAFKRASEHLVATGRVGIWGEHVWTTD